MKSERWQKVERIYHAALEREPDQRATFLNEACGGDESLRQEVESLLVQEEATGSFLEAPALEVAAKVMSEDPGRSLLGRQIASYQVLSLLGSGGMGEVYRAHDGKLGRDVALKVLPKAFAQDPERLGRLEREARMLASLNHPHIGAIYTLEESEGVRFLVLELVPGETLAERLKAGPLEVPEALRVCAQIAEALEAAHERGVIHRDLKPANVKVTPEGQVKVLDFGLAKAQGSLDLSQAATVSVVGTESGVILGTAPYMAPEQARGKPVDKRADIWAFGCVLYELLTGQRAFAGATVSDTIAAILEREPDWEALPQTTPAQIRNLLRRCFQKDARQRLRDIGDARLETEEALSHPGAVPETIRPEEAAPAAVAARRRRLGLAVGIAFLALLVGLYLFRGGWFRGPSPAWTLKPLTSFVGWEWGVTWSPDASFFAYGHTKYGHLDIFVMSTGGGEPIRLTDSPADDMLPHWSPNNNYIAFLSDRGTGTNVYLIPPLGGTERKLAETHLSWLERNRDANAVMGASPWSPDASELLFSRLNPSGEVAVWKINLSTGDQTQLIQPPPGAGDVYATWSFDGERIAFTRNQGGKSSLWLMDAQGGEPALLLADEYQNMQPAWSADGQRLVFISTRGGPRNLWEIDVGSGRLRQVTSGTQDALALAISPTGRLAYTPYSHQVDLYWGPVDRPQEEHQRLTSYTSFNLVGRVAPDGQQVVYYSNRTGNWELWLLERRTGAERQLTDHPANDRMADWSPDGQEIVFLSDREGTLQLWVLEVESGRVRRLSETSFSIPLETLFGGPRWSPDGKAIGFIAAGEKEQGLWVVDPQGENVRSPLAVVMGFDWYRTSRHVVYTGRASDGSLEMRVADLETGKEAILLRDPNAELVVAPDGRGVAYVHAASHLNMHLHLLRLAPPASPGELPRPVGEPRQLTRGEGAWHVHNGGWSPDSKAIVYTRDLDRGDVYVIENYR